MLKIGKQFTKGVMYKSLLFQVLSRWLQVACDQHLLQTVQPEKVDKWNRLSYNLK